MKRFKRHKVKEEKPEPSHSRENEQHDLAFYIHDRVELMHQVFSVLKLKEIKSMIPENIRNVSKDDLQELCTEELLGISSKRLCAILDGAEPPSDTESSSVSPERLETISLDSISSDEEILSQSSKKKKHKHKKHSKSKRKKTVTNDTDIDKQANKDGGEAQSRAARAGLTVLELLELQARARAIRAQLHKEQAKKASTSDPARSEHQQSSDDDAVQIKDEPALVVEISSDEEKPSVEALEKQLKQTTDAAQKRNETQPVNAKDLTVNVPAAKKTRKIKLNRQKSTTENVETSNSTVTVTLNNVAEPVPTASDVADDKPKENNKETKKGKKNKKKRHAHKDGSDHDEITLQLSDTEKMDLLEDFEGKKHDSSSSEDSESSSSDSGEESSNEKSHDLNANSNENAEIVKENAIIPEKVGETEESSAIEKVPIIINKENDLEEVKTELAGIELSSSEKQTENEETNKSVKEIETNIETQLNINKEVSNNTNGHVSNEEEPMEVDEHIEISNINELPVIEDTEKQTQEKDIQESNTEPPNVEKDDPPNVEKEKINDNIHNNPQNVEKDKITDNIDNNIEQNDETDVTPQKNMLQIVVEGNSRSVKSKTEIKSAVPEAEKKSDGELSNAESSEIEVIDLKPEVVCISDEENKKNKHKKKNKKKEKKVKKDKKKSKSDFCNASDENFFTKKIIEIVDQNDIIVCNDDATNSPKMEKTNNSTLTNEEYVSDNDDIYEILELSDSSCYEVEGVSVLSKEPTAEEIEALSAKIDEYEREEVVTDEQIRKHEEMLAAKEKEGNDLEQIENLSWKDRYLDSKKVKQILSMSNIMNAMRKKNIELKKKIAESKKEVVEQTEVAPVSEVVEKETEEGSIEQYKTLIGSTTFVDPVPEKHNGVTDDIDNCDASQNDDEKAEKQITREMKKDAKQLLKMYKKLLKYNDMNRPEDPNKKKKKKMKKKKSQINTS